MKLEKKNVFITGTSGGLGLELAKEFVENGFCVFGTGTNLERIESAKKYVATTNFHIFNCNNNNEAETAEILSQIISLDIYINNAGIYLDGIVTNNSIQKIKSVIETNLIGGIISTQLVLAKMEKQGYGIIVDINSNVSLKPKSNRSIYTAAKKGFDDFIDCVKLDYPQLKFVSVYPAGMKTDLHAKSGNPHSDYDLFLDPRVVANQIVQNLLLDSSQIKTKQYFERERK